MGIKGLLRMLLFCSLLSASTSLAAEIHGRIFTQLLFYSNEYLDDTRQIELNEYLRFSITNIDKAGKFSIYGYGRGFSISPTGKG